MTDGDTRTPGSEQDDPHRATPTRQSRLSPVWIVPLVALFIGAWLVYDNYSSRGPLISLHMPTAEGIEAGKTLIKTRNVEVGQVETVRLSEDLSGVEITARMTPEADPMLVEDSYFWVVKPRIGRGGISGLGTVLSGAYIQLEPGESDVSDNSFDVHDQPPVASPGAEGIRLTLVSQTGSSLKVADPVVYQGINVGQVEEAKFDVKSQTMQHRIFIESPYDQLVTENTRFWTASGLDVSLGADGIQVKVGSLESLIGGGLTFGVPEDIPAGAPVEADTTFQLYTDEEEARQGSFNRHLDYVLLVEDTVRGLSKGAPVEFRGVRIGTVAAVPWNFSSIRDEQRDTLAIPVLIRIEPQRLGLEMDIDEWKTRYERLFNAGLRATLKSGSLITGALFVELKFDPALRGQYTAETFAGRPVFPTSRSGLAQIQSQVTALLDKLNKLDVESVLSGLDRNLQVSEATLNQAKELVSHMNQLLGSPETQNLLGNLNSTLQELKRTIGGISPNSDAYQDLTRTLDEVETLMRDLQPAARKISDKPSSLIFDSLDTEDPIPRAPNTRSSQ
ncbi:intermembrane transport protein PqiB [Halomonas binhaiensis]|uniref:Intermembrane transport protein PqiB n=1 Tax=Halomonas binhaiensis TaxID=2562282 RepID=A0A5C1NGI3_9GAMM|nr:intermembrane transport protein PqiB [Halomonas binhaiensis]QEM81971.1 intermembrane transport protein PqiB [Halomonas binhaiensis]